jgi:hypothetical protein
MQDSSFDMDDFALSLAFHLLGANAVRKGLSSSSLYWRSPAQLQLEQRIWVDVSWEFSQSGSIHLLLGSLWRSSSGKGGLYVQSDALLPKDLDEHFGRAPLSIDISCTPASVLAKSTGEALKKLKHSSTATTSDPSSVELYYEDLDKSASFPLKDGARGSITEMEPIILDLMLRNIVTAPSVVDGDDSTPEEPAESMENLISVFREWQARCRASSEEGNSKRTNNNHAMVITNRPTTGAMPSNIDLDRNSGTTSGAIVTSPQESVVPTSSQEQHPKEKKKVVKRRGAHGFEKAAPRKKKGKELKFAASKETT